MVQQNEAPRWLSQKKIASNARKELINAFLIITILNAWLGKAEQLLRAVAPSKGGLLADFAIAIFLQVSEAAFV